MKFRVVRTSGGQRDGSPCDEATRRIFNNYTFTPGKAQRMEFESIA
jgi:hypothetical protein